MSTETSRRAEANRRNAQKSTGPRTAAGKENSRFNAVKHGLSARLDVLRGEDPGEYRARLEAWTAALNPSGEIERYLVERAVQISWQLDRADRAQAARVAATRFAGTFKAGEMADEVASLGRRLFWDPRAPEGVHPDPENAPDPASFPQPNPIDDPNDPARLVIRLEGSSLGCAWLLDRWGELRAILEEDRKWQPGDRFRAVRLLGQQPLEAINDRSVMMIYLACGAMDPTGPHPFADVTAGLPAPARERYLRWLDARGAISRMPADPEAGRDALLTLIQAEEEKLDGLVNVNLQRELARAECMGFDDTDVGECLRQYQLHFNRSLIRVLQALNKMQLSANDPGTRGSAAAIGSLLPKAYLRAIAARLGPDVSPPYATAGDARPATPAPASPPAHQSETIPTAELPAGPDSAPRTDATTARGGARFIPRPDRLVADVAPSPIRNPKNEPTAEPRPGRRPGDAPVSPIRNPKNEPTAEPRPAGPQAITTRNSKNEPNDPASPTARRSPAALLAIIGLALAALIPASVASEPVPRPTRPVSRQVASPTDPSTDPGRAPRRSPTLMHRL